MERNVVIFMKSGIERCGRNSLKPVVLPKPHGGAERTAEEPHSLWSLYQPIYTTDTIVIWSKHPTLWVLPSKRCQAGTDHGQI